MVWVTRVRHSGKVDYYDKSGNIIRSVSSSNTNREHKQTTSSRGRKSSASNSNSKKTTTQNKNVNVVYSPQLQAIQSNLDSKTLAQITENVRKMGEKRGADVVLDYGAHTGWRPVYTFVPKNTAITHKSQNGKIIAKNANTRPVTTRYDLSSQNGKIIAKKITPYPEMTPSRGIPRPTGGVVQQRVITEHYGEQPKTKGDIFAQNVEREYTKQFLRPALSANILGFNPAKGIYETSKKATNYVLSYTEGAGNTAKKIIPGPAGQVVSGVVKGAGYYTTSIVGAPYYATEIFGRTPYFLIEAAKNPSGYSDWAVTSTRQVMKYIGENPAEVAGSVIGAYGASKALDLSGQVTSKTVNEARLYAHRTLYGTPENKITQFTITSRAKGEGGVMQYGTVRERTLLRPEIRQSLGLKQDQYIPYLERSKQVGKGVTFPTNNGQIAVIEGKKGYTGITYSIKQKGDISQVFTRTYSSSGELVYSGGGVSQTLGTVKYYKPVTTSDISFPKEFATTNNPSNTYGQLKVNYGRSAIIGSNSQNLDASNYITANVERVSLTGKPLTPTRTVSGISDFYKRRGTSPKFSGGGGAVPEGGKGAITLTQTITKTEPIPMPSPKAITTTVSKSASHSGIAIVSTSVNVKNLVKTSKRTRTRSSTVITYPHIQPTRNSLSVFGGVTVLKNKNSNPSKQYLYIQDRDLSDTKNMFRSVSSSTLPRYKNLSKPRTKNPPSTKTSLTNNKVVNYKYTNIVPVPTPRNIMTTMYTPPKPKLFPIIPSPDNLFGGGTHKKGSLIVKSKQKKKYKPSLGGVLLGYKSNKVPKVVNPGIRPVISKRRGKHVKKKR